MKAVILAGGVGTRLWPLSRAARPKQFTNLVTEEPLLCDTYRRLLRSFASEDIYISTSPEFVPMVQEVLGEIEQSRIIIEPAKRDTGPAMGYVAAVLELVAPDESIVFIPSDHYIRDEERFLTTLRVAGILVEQTGKLVDIAVPATFPSTILGYTKIGDQLDVMDGVEVYRFAGHTEKPTYDVAKSYLEEGSYLWHANYYTWTPRAFMESLCLYAPDMGRSLRVMQEALQSGDQITVVEQFSSLVPISFDYAVTEKMSHEDVLILKGDFGWSDIGGWDTLYARLAEDQGAENVVPQDAIVIDAHGNLVRTSAKKLVALVGVEDLVIVDTEDALLITTSANAQRVKEVITVLRDRNAHHLL